MVVDNASTDGTVDWLKTVFFRAPASVPGAYWLLEENRYPGYACNLGWADAPPDATHLHRADNDMAFLPGWCEEVELRFRLKHRSLGQLGLRTRQEEFACAHNVGGNCVITRELFDKGLRYDERPWPQFPAGHSEDSYFSPAVRKMGKNWARVQRPCLESLASGDWEDPYYQRSYGDRRIRRPKGQRYGVR